MDWPLANQGFALGCLLPYRWVESRVCSRDRLLDFALVDSVHYFFLEKVGECLMVEAVYGLAVLAGLIHLVASDV
jgi:hypothetical protein